MAGKDQYVPAKKWWDEKKRADRFAAELAAAEERIAELETEYAGVMNDYQDLGRTIAEEPDRIGELEFKLARAQELLKWVAAAPWKPDAKQHKRWYRIHDVVIENVRDAIGGKSDGQE